MSQMKLLHFTLCATLILKTSFAFSSEHILGFESAEHVTAGDEINLYFEPNSGTTNYSLHLPNQINLTFGEIISMGDFYEIVDLPISLGQTEADRKTRFLSAFNSFAQNPDVKNELNQILAVIKNEKSTLDDGMKKGEKPEEIYKKIGSENNRQWNCITGGDCSSTYWVKPGRYLKLSIQDFSHFGNNSWLAYQAGHAAALEQAIDAHAAKDRQKLEVAYAMDAFACHFLSDRFSAGHIRTPRVELPNSVTPYLVGSLLVTFMHSEDNQNGLHVHNLRGDHWIAFGDRYYFEKNNEQNRRFLKEAMQLSANQIFTAYQEGVLPKDDVLSILPQPDDMKDKNYQDIAALFYYDENSKHVMRRKNVDQIFDYHWTADWWGWSTLILLSKQNGLPSEAQAQLALSDLRQKAIQDGLITDKSILKYLKNQ